jgi:hypothetical protein
MFLLISEFDRFKLDQTSCRHVRLSSLFESIRFGTHLIEGRRPIFRERLPAGDLEHPVVFLRIASLGEADGLIDWQVIREDMGRRNDNLPVREIDADDILQPTDYLISMRGTPRGFSLLRSGLRDIPEDLKRAGLSVAASNNFILMRPYPDGDRNIDFLHLMLDVLIGDMKDAYENVRKGGVPPAYLSGIRSITNANGPASTQTGNFIGVRDLKTLTLNIPVEREARERFWMEYEKLLDDEREARMNLLKFRTNFRDIFSLQ